MTNRTKKVYFAAGSVARRNVVGIAAYLYELVDSDAEFTRFYTYDHGRQQWWQQEFDHQIVSVEYTRTNRTFTWHLLSKRGVLIQISPSGVRKLDIPDADTGPDGYGYVSEVRLIGEHLYVCGFRRQVYRLESDVWKHIDHDILASENERDYSFESIDGTSENNIYAVGWKGEIYHFNGERWRKIDSPTNSNLTRVRCMAPDLVCACGYSGVFLQGSADSWHAVQDPTLSEHLWGLEVFQEIPYVAHLKGLSRFDGSQLISVDTGLRPEIGGYRLHARDGVLWAFGNDDLAFFDGNTWTRVVCPDNTAP